MQVNQLNYNYMIRTQHCHVQTAAIFTAFHRPYHTWF